MNGNDFSGYREVIVTVHFFHKRTLRYLYAFSRTGYPFQHLMKDVLPLIVDIENTACHHSLIKTTARLIRQMKHFQQRTVREMDMQIRVIGYHTITDGVEDIIKFITLLYQFVLHQQAGLSLHPPFGFAAVGAHQPYDRCYQQRKDGRIEKDKKEFIFFPIRLIDNDSTDSTCLVRLDMEKLQLLVVVYKALSGFCHSQFQRGSPFQDFGSSLPCCQC